MVLVFEMSEFFVSFESSGKSFEVKGLSHSFVI